MSQTAENALLNVQDDSIELWHMANEDANDVNIYEMIDFLVSKGKDPPLPLKPLTFYEKVFGRKTNIYDDIYNINLYDPIYIGRAKTAWKKYKEADYQIQSSAVESKRYQLHKFNEEQYSKIKKALLINIRNYDPMNPLYPTQGNDLKISLEDLKDPDKTDLKTALDKVIFDKTRSKSNGGKRVTRIKRSRRVKRSTKRRKH